MRVAIREQLALFVLVAVLVALTVVAVPTWLYVNDHIASNLRRGLSLTASLKASRITSQLELIQTSCYTISSRLLIQDALQSYYDTGDAEWNGASIDLTSALSVGANTGLLQARIFPRNTTGPERALLNVTSLNAEPIVLPYAAPNGSEVRLGDPEYGYPPNLYPNITYIDLDRANSIRPDVQAMAAEAFPGVWISQDGGLLLGPLVLNETTALLSVSVPIRDNRDAFILGYMTVVAIADSIIDVAESREGLDGSGVVLIIGSTNPWNRYNDEDMPSNDTYAPSKEHMADVPVHFVLPPTDKHGGDERHSKHQLADGTADHPFLVKQYPALLETLTQQNDAVNNASAKLKTHNEQGYGVSVGFARTQTSLANWTVIVEKSQEEAYEPIRTLRNILLGTVFGTAGLLLLIVFPMAHFSVLPIRKLKSATEKSVNPPGWDDSFSESSEYEPDDSPGSGSGRMSSKSKKGFMTTISRLIKGNPVRPTERDHARRMFKIPGKVDDRKHLITDELTELTKTFNDMSDELVKQYMSLDEKVAERTKELSESKKAAEAANESKTLFIANISHELKTPLNAILGLCEVCLKEGEVARIKESLKTIYESGDLLLHLLEDLLSFSKNQIGHQIAFEPKEFRLADVRTQILSIFDKQIRDRDIDFTVTFINTHDAPLDADEALPEKEAVPHDPNSKPPKQLETMQVWGDHHRILQVIINLVSNSLKFTPQKGKVEVRIKCLGEDLSTKPEGNSRTSSILSKSNSRNSRNAGSRYRGAGGSVQSASTGQGGPNGSVRTHTALAINPMDPKSAPHIHMANDGASTPRGGPGSRAYVFEFEVEDNGPGIPEKLQDKVFEPFVQADAALSKKYGGTGLGLSICQQLAVLMGGSITLSSIEGLGTTFTMHLPLRYARSRSGSNASSALPGAATSNAPAEAVSCVTAGAPCPPTDVKPSSTTPLNAQPRLVGLSQPYFSGAGHLSDAPPLSTPIVSGTGAIVPGLIQSDTPSKLRVLVADDNKINVQVVRQMLKQEHVQDVTVAKDGQEAYDLVKGTMERNQPYDVIFMDVQMPNVDGIQSTRLIRGIGYTSPIVALTAFSEESNVKDCMESGMNEFLAKPIKRPALKQVLKRFATIPEEPEMGSKGAKPERSPDERKRDSGFNGLGEDTRPTPFTPPTHHHIEDMTRTDGTLG